MTSPNGNTYWTRWLVGCLYALLVLALTTMASHVVANDKDSRARDDKIDDKVQSMSTDIATIKTSVKYIEQTQAEQKAHNEKFMQLLERVNSKV